MRCKLASLIQILFVLSSLFFVSTSKAESRYKLGLIAPLTGPVAQHGRAVLEGLQLGLKAGDCKDRVVLFVEDDGFDPKKSISAAHKFINEDKINLLLGVGSGPTHALAPITEQTKLPFFALAGDASVSRGRKYTVRLRPPASYEGLKIAELAESEHISSAALICSSNEFTLAVCDGIASSLDGKIAMRQDLLPEETDFKTIIAKIRQLNVSHIIPILSPGKLGLFAKQVRELKVNSPFLGGTFFESTSDLDVAGHALLDSKYLMFEVASSFRQQYLAIPSISPGSIAWSAIFYDAGRVICEALKKKLDPLVFVKTLVKFPGAVGKVNFFSEKEDQYLSYEFVKKQITSSGFVQIH